MKDKQNVLHTASKKYYPLAGGSSQVTGQSVLFSNKTKQPKGKKKKNLISHRRANIV